MKIRKDIMCYLVVVLSSIVIVSAFTSLFVSCGTDHPQIEEEKPAAENQDRKDNTANAKEMFTQLVLPLLEKKCKGCHANPAPEYNIALSKIVPKKPEESVLYRKASGIGHTSIWTAGSSELKTLHDWITAEASPKEEVKQVTLDPIFFNAKVKPLLVNNVFESDPPGCTGCHTKDSVWKEGRLGCLKCHPSGPPADEMKWSFNKAVLFVVPGKPEESLLMQIAGSKHMGMEIPSDSEQYKNLEKWIKGEKLP